MKKVLTVLLSVISLTAGAQKINGKMEVFDLDNCRLHVYMSQEAMGDVSTVIEGGKGLVILEQPSSVNSIKEFNDYVKKLGKPVVKVIADYHTGGLAEYPDDIIVMVEGMPEFEKGDIYGGMLKNFANIFGEAMDLRPHGKVATVPVNSEHTWAGVDFIFSQGAESDFPASSILIDGKAYYTHFAPAKAHFGTLQIPNREAINAVLKELEHARSTGSTVFLGSHGAPAGIEEVDFQINYLKKMKELLAGCSDADSFEKALTDAYPGLPGAEGLKDMSEKIQNRSACFAIK